MLVDLLHDFSTIFPRNMSNEVGNKTAENVPGVNESASSANDTQVSSCTSEFCVKNQHFASKNITTKKANNTNKQHLTRNAGSAHRNGLSKTQKTFFNNFAFQNNIYLTDPISLIQKENIFSETRSEVYQTVKDKLKILLQKDFDLKKFAKINNFSIDERHIHNTNIIKRSFKHMNHVCLLLLNQGIRIRIKKHCKFRIKITADEILGACGKIESSRLNEEEKAYKLYDELGKIILEKLLKIVRNNYCVEDDKKIRHCLSKEGRNIIKDILTLPLIDFADNIELFERMTGTIFAECGIPKPSDKETNSPAHQKLDPKLERFGIFFAFENKKLAKKMLPAARFATKIGLKTKLNSQNGELTLGMSREISYDAMSKKIESYTNSISTKADQESTNKLSHKMFYCEIIQHARNTVGAIDIDKSIVGKNLKNVFKGHDDIIGAIKSQISEYSLTDYEEYIAEFGSRILCCLEQDKNPFDYITDERLWRLYYEFGGPDFIPIINERIFKNDEFNMLTDKSFDWCSGHPSKFGVDINQIKDQQVEVEGMVAIGQKSFVKIDKTTILPPPPMGYRYTTEKGKLQLKDLKSKKYYDPTFCSLTNWPLTLMKTKPDLKHHFELFPKKSSGALEMLTTKKLKLIKPLKTKVLQTMAAIGSAIKSVVKFPITVIKRCIRWLKSF